MKDPNLIYPGSDLTNVFPEEGMDTISDNTSGMKPTQAQIEAEHNWCPKCRFWKPLTLRVKSLGPLCRECDIKITNEILTAAAEVGDKEFDPQDWLNDVERFRACMHRTIERCAQVADNCPAVSIYAARIIAAAIRALKDKP